MAALVWGQPDSRLFDAGVSHGVLFVDDKPGVAWSGLTGVEVTPVGGESRPYYLDGEQYLDSQAPVKTEATISAYMSPPEFDACDGTIEAMPGLRLTRQRRSKFHFSWRTEIGNGSDELEYGYKIHLLYNVMATPAPRAHRTLTNSFELPELSWKCTTRPAYAGPYQPTAYLTISSPGLSGEFLEEISNLLYGTATTKPRIPSIEELLNLFATWGISYEILGNEVTGLGRLRPTLDGDIRGFTEDGIFVKTKTSRLRETATPGINTLETQ